MYVCMYMWKNNELFESMYAHVYMYHQEIYKHHVDLINTVIPGGVRKGQCFIRAKGSITGAMLSMYIVAVY